ncbi:hypothetical protein [Pseudomonas borbori]|nr:hypothetical protein [Pseudomonas borbori]
MRDFYLFVVRIVSLAPMGQFASRTLPQVFSVLIWLSRADSPQDST